MKNEFNFYPTFGRTLAKLFLLYLVALFAFTSCEEPEKIEPNTPGQGANTVSGKAVDGRGNPMAGVKVRAENPAGYNVYVEGTTKNDGTYSLTLPVIGSWKIYAWKEVTYKDKTFHLRLGMNDDADYDFFTTGENGAVKNFVWKLNGRIPDRSASLENGWGYFGGSLRFVNVNSKVPVMAVGTKVTVTLTPTSNAKYLDGTPATTAGTVKKTFTINNGPGQNYYIGDIPVTEYRMSIESELNGVKKQVYVGGNDYNNLYEWLEFDFTPAAGSSGSYENGISSPTDFPYYMGQKN
ncbi:MAG: carboxypeptidase-like regulatory domain-containing protein [Adhaeribacter sp.]